MTETLENRDPQQEQAEYERQERRVRGVLDRLAFLQHSGTSRGRTSASGYVISAWEWKIAIEWACRRVGDVGIRVLDERLRRDAAFKQIGWKLGISADETVLMYQVSLLVFIGELDKCNRNGVPDDYAEQVAA